MTITLLTRGYSRDNNIINPGVLYSHDNDITCLPGGIDMTMTLLTRGIAVTMTPLTQGYSRDNDTVNPGVAVTMTSLTGGYSRDNDTVNPGV